MLAKAFEFYEASVQKGLIKSYGISGHNSFRGLNQRMLNGDLNYPVQQVSELVRVAQQVAGAATHNFKYI